MSSRSVSGVVRDGKGAMSQKCLREHLLVFDVRLTDDGRDSENEEPLVATFSGACVLGASRCQRTTTGMS